MRSLSLIAILLVSTPVFALNPTGTGYEDSLCRTKFKDKDGRNIYKHCKKPSFNVIGLAIDAGAPSGLGFSLIGRPLKFLQAELGGTTTLVGGGVKAGLSVFLPWYISPGVTIEGGKQWAGNINHLVAMFGSNPNISLLNSVDYEYVSFLGKIGFGSPSWFMFNIFAGYSYITTTTNGLQAFLQKQSNDNSITTKEVTANVWCPTAKIQFLVYF